MEHARWIRFVSSILQKKISISWKNGFYILSIVLLVSYITIYIGSTRVAPRAHFLSTLDSPDRLKNISVYVMITELGFGADRVYTRVVLRDVKTQSEHDILVGDFSEKCISIRWIANDWLELRMLSAGILFSRVREAPEIEISFLFDEARDQRAYKLKRREASSGEWKLHDLDPRL